MQTRPIALDTVGVVEGRLEPSSYLTDGLQVMGPHKPQQDGGAISIRRDLAPGTGGDV